VNKYRFSDNGVERELQIPIEQFWDVNGREDAIEIYEQDVVEQVINPTEDFEVTRFDHESYRIVNKDPDVPQTEFKSSVNYQFYFLPDNVDVTGATSSDWVNNYNAAGFTNKEIYYSANSYKNSFFKLDFYDTNESQSQQIYFTIILPSYQGQTNNVNIGSNTVPKNVNVRIPTYYLDYIGDKEGFFVYWLKDRGYINLDEFYMSVKYFNGKTGEFTRMMIEPQTLMPNIFTFNKEDKFYTKIVLDYDNYQYKLTDLNGIRIGTTDNPVKFYEYVNP
jgi:hypothetical protein